MVNTSANSIAIIGQGYVGLPLAMTAASACWNVVGIDSDKERVERLNHGSSPIEDVSDIILTELITSKRYRASAEFSEVRSSSVIVICVPTPLNDLQKPDLGPLKKAILSIAPFISDQTLVISESTSFPGTLRNFIIPLINSMTPNKDKRLYFATAPERVNPRDPNWNQKNTPRVISGIDRESTQKAMNFYETFCDNPIAISTPEIAEAAKLLENSFRLVNIALINEFTKICSAAGIGVNEVIDAASTKPYGFMPFRPGVGVGGHCIPVDPLYLTWWARELEIDPTIIELANSINRGMPEYVADKAIRLIDGVTNKPRILIIGVAYKPGVSDVRETPILSLRNSLTILGARVAWHDPLVKSWEGTAPVNLDWKCDLIIVAVAQPNFDFEDLLARNVPILDCTNTLVKSKNVYSL